MPLPLLLQYAQAVQNTRFFKDEKSLKPIMYNGEPQLIAGAFGCVFKMQHSDGSYHALKCFTKYVPDKQQRMEAIAGRLQTVESGYIVHYRYLPQELWVNSADTTWYDVVLMEWVEGKTLGEAVRDAATSKNKAALQQLADNFIEMGLWLLAQDFAHGDLKHDNILVRPNGSLALIDYDGMYVPALKGKQAENKGVEEYQHPERTLQHFNKDLDDYSIAVIGAALLALAQEPGLYGKYGNAERLLFSRTDLLAPAASPLIKELQALQNATINRLLQLLQESIAVKSLHLPGLAAALRPLPGLVLPPDIAETEQLIKVKEQEIMELQNEVTTLKQHLEKLQDNATIVKVERVYTAGPFFKKLKILPLKLLAHMKYIKGGSFEMGDVFGDSRNLESWYGNRERPVHRVRVDDFYMSAYCVTFEEYDAFCTATGREKPGDAGCGRGKLPVIYVTWYDAVEYCNWLSKQQGLTPTYTINGNHVSCNWSANGYRLPTEAEWEYAAREGGKKVRFGNGQNILRATEANFDARASYKQPYSEVGENRGKTVPVDSFLPNGLGLYNMSGNVWEWCWDWSGKYYYQNSPQANPRGASSGSLRVLRGGGWYNDPQDCRVASRSNIDPTNHSSYDGFRLVIVPQL